MAKAYQCECGKKLFSGDAPRSINLDSNPLRMDIPYRKLELCVTCYDAIEKFIEGGGSTC